MTTRAPELAFGVPVRDGEKTLGRTLDSLLKQDFEDFEIVVCDNASSDDTQALCERYAAMDPRVRYFRNPEDIGQIENFNRVFELARGEFFRWLGSGDTLDPSYARKCVGLLEANPDSVGITTLWDFVNADGERETSDYRGERLESSKVHRRVARLVWFQTQDRLDLDPVYSLMRRQSLLDTKVLRISANTDHVLSLEMVLRGSFCHLSESLACRLVPERAKSIDLLAQQYHASLSGKDRVDFGVRFAEFRGVVDEQAVPLVDRLRLAAVLWYHRFRSPPYMRYRHLKSRVRHRLARLFARR